MKRYEIVRSTKYFGFIIWDTKNEVFLKRANGSLQVFEDETEAYIFIESLEAK